MDGYKTIKRETFAEFTEQKSKFIGYISPAQTEEMAVEFINKIKKKHSNATHNVYAYLLREGQKQRYTDDNEPQGTAGIPVLEVMLHSKLTDCVIVVTRYFGGVLLGTGGLVRAYTNSAKMAVERGEVVTMALCGLSKVICDYKQYSIIENLLLEQNAIITDSVFLDKVEINFYIPLKDIDLFNKKLMEITSGSVEIQLIDEKYMPIEK